MNNVLGKALVCAATTVGGAAVGFGSGVVTGVFTAPDKEKRGAHAIQLGLKWAKRGAALGLSGGIGNAVGRGVGYKVGYVDGTNAGYEAGKAA